MMTHIVLFCTHNLTPRTRHRVVISKIYDDKNNSHRVLTYDELELT